ncbi:hypothetical protein PoB_000801300 [Plakobranchus ocellatus]|uniref:Uncharacterized protein n=1 Tax=Plakobranchus ocellatus TaxID=259542 RepID=A0AAV3YGI1_9GAST|nr:hypothetical protein PoB_000801300 [Plakobranchus ocellatus]
MATNVSIHHAAPATESSPPTYDHHTQHRGKNNHTRANSQHCKKAPNPLRINQSKPFHNQQNKSSNANSISGNQSCGLESESSNNFNLMQSQLHETLSQLNASLASQSQSKSPMNDPNHQEFKFDQCQTSELVNSIEDEVQYGQAEISPRHIHQLPQGHSEEEGLLASNHMPLQNLQQSLNASVSVTVEETPTITCPVTPPKQRPITPTKPRPVTPTKLRPVTPTKPRPVTPTTPTNSRPITPTSFRPVTPTKPSSIKPRPITPTITCPTSPTIIKPQLVSISHPASAILTPSSPPLAVLPQSPSLSCPATPLRSLNTTPLRSLNSSYSSLTSFGISASVAASTANSITSVTSMSTSSISSNSTTTSTPVNAADIDAAFYTPPPSPPPAPPDLPPFLPRTPSPPLPPPPPPIVFNETTQDEEIDTLPATNQNPSVSHSTNVNSPHTPHLLRLGSVNPDTFESDV